MAKRMSLDFGQTGYPAFEKVPEHGKPVPCALGRPWVTLDTQVTLSKLRIPRTDPWGRPLPGEPDDPIMGPYRASAPHAGAKRSEPT